MYFRYVAQIIRVYESEDINKDTIILEAIKEFSGYLVWVLYMLHIVEVPVQARVVIPYDWFVGASIFI